jgi:hypothetical protein
LDCAANTVLFANMFQMNNNTLGYPVFATANNGLTTIAPDCAVDAARPLANGGILLLGVNMTNIGTVTVSTNLNVLGNVSAAGVVNGNGFISGNGVGWTTNVMIPINAAGSHGVKLEFTNGLFMNAAPS